MSLFQKYKKKTKNLFAWVEWYFWWDSKSQHIKKYFSPSKQSVCIMTGFSWFLEATAVILCREFSELPAAVRTCCWDASTDFSFLYTLPGNTLPFPMHSIQPEDSPHDSVFVAMTCSTQWQKVKTTFLLNLLVFLNDVAKKRMYFCEFLLVIFITSSEHHNKLDIK